MRKTDENAKPVSKLPITLIVNGLIGTFIGMILLFLFAMLIAKEAMPEGALRIMPAVSAFIAAFIAAFASSKTLGRTLLTSLIQSVVSLALFYISGMIIFMRIIPGTMNLYCFLACVAGAILGGLIAAGRKSRRRRI